MKAFSVGLLIVAGVILLKPGIAISDTDYVQIEDRGTYYSVTIDYTSATPAQIGAELGADLETSVPNIESIIDSYLAEKLDDVEHAGLITRANVIKNQVPDAFEDEVDAMAAGMDLGDTNTRGDGLLSYDELWMINLFPEVARATQCSALSVFGSASSTGKTQLMRIMDWDPGSSYQLAKIHAVETLALPGGKTVVNIGFLGYRAMLTGYNSDGVFGGQLDSGTGATYSATNKRSYSFDLRYAMQNCSTLTAVAAHLSDAAKEYPYNHLIFLADKTSSAVLENNFSGTGSNMRRALRMYDSSLHDHVEWGFTDAVGTVNSFLLEGNHNNHTGASFNYNRFAVLKGSMTIFGPKISWDELKQIASYDNNDGPGSMSTGDIYNSINLRIIMFEPNTGKLEIAFHPRNSGLPADPTFMTIFEGNNPAAMMPVLNLLLLQ